MAFYPRKILLAKGINHKEETEEDDGVTCSCYNCPANCSPVLPPPHHKHQISTLLIVSLCILGVGFLFLSYFAILRCRSRRRRNSPPQEINIFREDIVDEAQGPVIDHPIWYIRTVGLPQPMIDSIQVFKYKKRERLIEGSDCAVCLSEFEEDESLRLLPKCSHAFHVSCIDTWLRSHKNCPVCRAPVMMIAHATEVSSEETSSSHSESPEESDEEIDDTRDEIGRNRRRFRVVSDLADHRVKVDQELEGVRRSVSMDFSSASRIYKAVAHVHPKKGEGSCNNSSMFHDQIQNS